VIDAGIDALVRQQPVQQLPMHARQILPRPDCTHEPLRPLTRLIDRKALKNTVFQSSQIDRNSEPDFVLNMISVPEQASDGAALAIFPVSISLL